MIRNYLYFVESIAGYATAKKEETGGLHKKIIFKKLNSF